MSAPFFGPLGLEFLSRGKGKLRLSEQELKDLKERSLAAKAQGHKLALAQQYVALLQTEVGECLPPGVLKNSAAHVLALIAKCEKASRQAPTSAPPPEAPKITEAVTVVAPAPDAITVVAPAPDAITVVAPIPVAATPAEESVPMPPPVEVLAEKEAIPVLAPELEPTTKVDTKTIMAIAAASVTHKEGKEGGHKKGSKKGKKAPQ